MSSRLRDLTESTEPEGRDDTHQRYARHWSLIIDQISPHSNTIMYKSITICMHERVQHRVVFCILYDGPSPSYTPAVSTMAVNVAQLDIQDGPTLDFLLAFKRRCRPLERYAIISVVPACWRVVVLVARCLPTLGRATLYTVAAISTLTSSSKRWPHGHHLYVEQHSPRHVISLSKPYCLLTQAIFVENSPI